MKSRFEVVREELKHAFERFREILQYQKDEVVRDSAIKRFEFTYELAWKTLKELLKEKGVEVYTPRDTFRSAFQAGLIEDDPRWLQMIDTRNATSHIYNEAMAEGVYQDLPQYLPIIEKLVKDLGS